jgi:alkanesulfonate monooxygenase SsuD/methylene tetrahydromethanopterin reductase-like flavin-dependent oxidoreductase (luciferase family)
MGTTETRVAVLLLGAPRIDREMVRLAREAEAQGFESVRVAETRMTRDAVAPVAAIEPAIDAIA